MLWDKEYWAKRIAKVGKVVDEENWAEAIVRFEDLVEMAQDEMCASIDERFAIARERA